MRTYNRSSKQIADDFLKRREKARQVAEEVAAEKARQVAEEVAQLALRQQRLEAMRRKATAERQAMMERALISKTEGWDNPSSPGSSGEGSYHDESSGEGSYHDESLPAEGKYHGESSDAQSSDIEEKLRTVIARSSSSKDGQPADAS